MCDMYLTYQLCVKIGPPFHDLDDMGREGGSHSNRCTFPGSGAHPRQFLRIRKRLREGKNKDESTGHKLMAKEVWETPQPAKRGKAGLLITKVGIVIILSLFGFSEKSWEFVPTSWTPQIIFIVHFKLFWAFRDFFNLNFYELLDMEGGESNDPHGLLCYHPHYQM